MEHITLRLFWISMLSCASLALVGIWFEARVPEHVFKLVATFFILGLASFLIWSPLIVYRFLVKSQKQHRPL